MLSLALLCACGIGGQAIPPVQPFTEPGFAAAGEHELHYALVMTRDLASGMAGSYGIVPRRDPALLTITLARRSTPGGTRLAPARLEATAIGLTGSARSSRSRATTRPAARPGWQPSQCDIACRSRSRFARARRPRVPRSSRA